MVDHLKKQEQQRLDDFCKTIEFHLNGRISQDKPGLESSDYEMIDMRGHSRRTDSLSDRQRYEGALKELYSFTFSVNYDGEEDTYPVGKFGVAHPKFPEVPLVLDWRSDTAMIAARFNGEAIQVPDGHIVGKTDLDLDRLSRRVRSVRSQKAKFPHRASIFKQEKSETKHMKVQTVDDKEWLGRELSKTQQHRSIDGFISTRQAEQNRIIQMPISTYMIVQGAAGSGKTLTALHRMSYLQYHDPRRKMLYLGPNEATLQQMLKDAEHLQIQTVSTYSFKEWTRRFKIKEVSPQQVAQLMPLYRGSDLLEWTEEATSEWRTEMEEKLRQYRPPEGLEHLHEKALTIWFEGEGTELQRRDRVLQMLRSESERLQILNKERYEAERERDALRWSRHLSSLKARRLNVLMTQNLNEQLVSENLTRQRLISFWNQTTTLSADALWALLKNPNYARRLKQRHGTDLLNAWHDSRYATQLDRFFLMFLQYEVEGYPEKWSHLLIDEGQTLTPLDVMVLAKLSHGMTVFGDVLQSYHAHETTSWSSLLASEKQEWRIEYLTKVFRSTHPITSLAKQLLSRAGHDTSRIDPFDRAGKPVAFLKTSSSKDIKHQLESWRSSGLSICIIAPTIETAVFLDEKLPFPTQLLRSENKKIGDEIIISTIDFLRGMEFDAVLLMYVDGTNYPTRPSMARKLYVSLTRALHEVVIHTKDDYSPLLGSVIETARA